MNELQINLKEYEGKPVVSSKEIATNFEKQHKHVLESIENLKEGVAEKSADLFIESKYQHPQNKQWYKEYLLTRDGFSLLVMGFTGTKALEWKLKYIEAFNKMEEYIKQQLPQLTRKQELQLAILNGSELERVGALKEYEGLIQKPLIDEINEKDAIIDKTISDEGLFDIGVVGKMLKPYNQIFGAKNIFKFLREKDVLIDNPSTQKHNNPYDKYNKYFEMRNVNISKGCGTETHIKTYFNGKGLKWFLHKIAKEQYITIEIADEISSKLN